MTWVVSPDVAPAVAGLPMPALYDGPSGRHAANWHRPCSSHGDGRADCPLLPTPCRIHLQEQSEVKHARYVVRRFLPVFPGRAGDRRRTRHRPGHRPRPGARRRRRGGGRPRSAGRRGNRRRDPQPRSPQPGPWGRRQRRRQRPGDGRAGRHGVRPARRGGEQCRGDQHPQGRRTQPRRLGPGDERQRPRRVPLLPGRTAADAGAALGADRQPVIDRRQGRSPRPRPLLCLEVCRDRFQQCPGQGGRARRGDGQRALPGNRRHRNVARQGRLVGPWRQAGESEAQSWERHQASLLPQGEAQTVEDMGQLVVYLACAPHVTGQAIAVDGGFSL